MRTPNIVTGSTFFCGYTNEKFDKAAAQAISEVKSTAIDWWQSNGTHPLHCTLGNLFVVGGKVPSKQAVEKLKVKTAKIAEKFQESILTKVTGYKIAKNGWVLLELKNEEKIKKIHEAFITAAEKLGFTPSPFSKQNYLPHISIGTLKAGADQNQAKEMPRLL